MTGIASAIGLGTRTPAEQRVPGEGVRVVESPVAAVALIPGGAT